MLGIILPLCLITTALLLLPSCTNDIGDEVEKGLPTYQVGDRWVWFYSMESGRRFLTEVIVDEEMVEGRDSYVIDMVFDPVISWNQNDTECTVSGMTYWLDKATILYGIKLETSTSCNGQIYASTETYDYNPQTSLFPLEIGKKIEIEKTTILHSNGEQSGNPVVTTEVYKVNSKEDITVAAGGFSCWKITLSDSAGNVTRTTWWSNEVKSVVKMTDTDGNIIMALRSYSVD